MIGDFHFLRPGWLLALVPALLIWLMVRRRQDTARAWRGIIAPHLLPHLIAGADKQSRFGPVPLLALAWLLGIFALAGPTWRREPAPFSDDTAPVAVVMKVTPSMRTEDVPPDRLSRGVQKLHDLLALRPGAKTALIAYGGSAHVVMPKTSDAGIINTFAGALDPKIMPGDGDAVAAAFGLADRTLEGSGSILWITDSVALENAAALAAWRKKSGTTVRVLAAVPPDGAEFQTLSRAADVVDADVVALTADESDVRALARGAKFAPSSSPEGGERWRDDGYWLVPGLALVLLLFFRAGWMVPSAARG